MAMRVSVVPVSTMPAVLDKMFVDEPYLIDWSMPQKKLEGEVGVIGLCMSITTARKEIRCQRTPQRLCTQRSMTYAKEMDPMNFEGSVPPYVASPFTISSDSVG